jgi:hypothetical protein
MTDVQCEATNDRGYRCIKTHGHSGMLDADHRDIFGRFWPSVAAKAAES